MKNVWFDATVLVRPDTPPNDLERIAARIRQIGVERVLYGSDAATSPITYPKAGWTAFQRLPLTAPEFRVIANNVTPYMRDMPKVGTSNGRFPETDRIRGPHGAQEPTDQVRAQKRNEGAP